MPSPSSKTSYHHGDLRGSLIAAAEHLMAEKSSWTFTLREVARAAGVSHNAPYNHFPDRLALLAAIASRGFEALSLALRRDLQAVGSVDFSASLGALAQAYVAFALAHPARYRLMFSAELANCNDTAFRAAGEQAFMVLHDLVARGVASRAFRVDPHDTHALTAWALVHGLGTLLLDGKVPGIADREAAAALTAAAAATLIDGLSI